MRDAFGRERRQRRVDLGDAAAPSEAASASAVTGPRPSRRAAHDFRRARPRASRCARANSSGASIGGAALRLREDGLQLRQPLGRDPQSRRVARARRRDRSAASRGAARQARRESRCHAGARATSAGVTKPKAEQRVVQLVGVAGLRPGFARTRSIAAASSRPRSAAVPSSSQRRLITACVRRSSSGASSRKAYGRAVRIS